MQYIKIKEAIIEQIESGVFVPGQKLPAERKLAELFETTRVTLREALSNLETDGQIYREDRRGWFISPQPLKYDPASTLSFAETAKAQGRTPETKMILAKSMLAKKDAARLLDLPPFTDIYCIKRVCQLETRPVAYMKHFIKQIPFPGLLNYDLDTSLAEIYRKHYGITYQRTRYKVSITSLIGEIAQALHATPGTPAILLERINYNLDGAIIDGNIEYWRHDAVCIETISELI